MTLKLKYFLTKFSCQLNTCEQEVKCVQKNPEPRTLTIFLARSRTQRIYIAGKQPSLGRISKDDGAGHLHDKEREGMVGDEIDKLWWRARRCSPNRGKADVRHSCGLRAFLVQLNMTAL